MLGSANHKVEPSGPAGSPEEPRWALVERVAASAVLQKSPRLRELLLYLCGCAIQDPRSGVSEQQVGVEVFGRRPGYDSSTDTIVRVHVSHLRKKLDHYFLSEGRDEAVVIDLPKGSYVPVFRAREQAGGAESAPARTPARPRWLIQLLSGLLVVALAVCGWLAYRNMQLGAGLLGAPLRTPALDRFWGQLFQKGRQVQVVVSDANLMMLTDILDRPITLNDYRHRTYPRGLLETHLSDPKIRALADHISGTHLTPVQETDVIRAISPLSVRYQIPMSVVFARDFRLLPKASDNLILLGHKKGNPWVELFEERMNFRYTYFGEAQQRSGTILNQAPLAGEQRRYPVEYGVQGYCLIAYLPKPIGEGTALLVFGTDMSSVEAGGQVISDDGSIARLLARLGVRGAERIPYFEVLLRTKLLVNVAPGFEFLAHRLPRL